MLKYLIPLFQSILAKGVFNLPISFPIEYKYSMMKMFMNINAVVIIPPQNGIKITNLLSKINSIEAKTILITAAIKRKLRKVIININPPIVKKIAENILRVVEL